MKLRIPGKQKKSRPTSVQCNAICWAWTRTDTSTACAYLISNYKQQVLPASSA